MVDSSPTIPATAIDLRYTSAMFPKMGTTGVSPFAAMSLKLVAKVPSSFGSKTTHGKLFPAKKTALLSH